MPCTSSCESRAKGRKTKAFEECSDRAKRYKAAALVSQFPQQQLSLASEMIEKEKNPQPYIDSSIVLALIMDADLTKMQYNSIRNVLQSEGYNILPPYNKLSTEKEKCYPENINVTETSASVNLQSLLDHTTNRIFETFSTETLESLSPCNYTLTSKWGCDGSSGHAEYKQNLPKDVNDGSMYLLSMVPLMLQSDNNIEYWRNCRPSSTRYCRPISFEFARETKEKVMEVNENMKSDIAALNSTKVVVTGKEINVLHKLLFTMLDGKTAQIVTHTTAAAVCYICGAKPTEMNNLELVSMKTIKPEACELGISSLHARIKFMECILHIAYNLPFQKWAATFQNKEIKRQNKLKIQAAFKDKMRLRVDFVQQGTGTSNDGNTSRLFFQTHKLLRILLASVKNLSIDSG